MDLGIGGHMRRCGFEERKEAARLLETPRRLAFKPRAQTTASNSIDQVWFRSTEWGRVPRVIIQLRQR